MEKDQIMIICVLWTLINCSLCWCSRTFAQGYRNRNIPNESINHFAKRLINIFHLRIVWCCLKCKTRGKNMLFLAPSVFHHYIWTINFERENALKQRFQGFLLYFFMTQIICSKAHLLFEIPRIAYQTTSSIHHVKIK